MKTVRHLLLLKGKYIWSIQPNETVYEGIRRMAAKEIGALVVLEGDKLVGIFSERDYARKVILLGKASKETMVSEIMTKNVIVVHPDQTTQECMELMTERHIRHLPVVEDDKVIGMISIGDVVRDIIYQQRETIKNLEGKILKKPE
jgi:CBS domain-containing protein